MSIRVLVVDDSPAVRLVLRSALQRVGVGPRDIFDAGNARDGWACFRRVHPELVLMDLSLEPTVEVRREGRTNDAPDAPPGRAAESGEWLAKRMLYSEPATRLVVCTGHPPDSPSVREVVKYGAYCVFFKPVTLDKVRRLFQLLAADAITLSSPSKYGPSDWSLVSDPAAEPEIDPR